MPDQGMFEPPFDSRWTIIQFEDCYLLVARGRLPYSPKQYFILPSVIRYLVTILPKSLALSKLENPTMQLVTLKNLWSLIFVEPSFFKWQNAA